MSTILVTVKFPPFVTTFIDETVARTGLSESDVARVLVEYDLHRSWHQPFGAQPKPAKLRAAVWRMVEVAERPPKPVVEPPWAAHVRTFLAECTVKDAESLIWNPDFYAAYVSWATANKVTPISHRALTQVAVQEGLTHSNASGRPWIGLRLRDDVAPLT